jgi:hypothetical protein
MYNTFGSCVTDGGICVTRMLDKSLYVVDESDVPVYLLQSALSPFLQIFSVIDSSHSSGNSSLFQIELISLWISERIVLYRALIISSGICQYPVICALVSFL